MSVTTPARAAVDRLIEEHFRAEAAVDLPAVMATLTEDVRHEIVGQGELRGREAAGAGYERIFSNLAVERFRPVRRLYGDGFAVDEVIVDGRAVGRVGGREGHGRPVHLRLLHIFEFRDGLIAVETAFMDLVALRQQLA